MKRTGAFSRVGIVLAAMIAFGTAGGDAQVTKVGNAYKFRVKFVKGETAKYSMVTSWKMAGQANAPNMTADLTSKVQGVKNGIATVEYKIIPKSGGMMGNKPQTMTVKMNDRGKVVGGSEQLSQMGMQSALPQQPVRIGQTWTESTPVNTPMGKFTTKATYTFVNIKTVGKHQVANLNVKVSGSGSGMSVNGGGSLQIRMADGSAHAMSLKQTMKMSAGGNSSQPMTVNIDLKVTRVK